MENSKLRSAICEFKKIVEPITKDKENPFFKSKYADMALILEVIDKPLADCGLTLNSYTTYESDNLVVKTELGHKDTREVLISTFPTFGGKAQEIGSSITYARRYNVQALLNLAAEDDDGNAANSAKPIIKKPNATENKKKYELYINKLASVKDKETWLKAKPFKDEWVMWAETNYGQDYGDQLNNKFNELSAKFEPIPTSQSINDDIPDFLKQ